MESATAWLFSAAGAPGSVLSTEPMSAPRPQAAGARAQRVRVRLAVSFRMCAVFMIEFPPFEGKLGTVRVGSVFAVSPLCLRRGRRPGEPVAGAPQGQEMLRRPGIRLEL